MRYFNITVNGTLYQVAIEEAFAEGQPQITVNTQAVPTVSAAHPAAPVPVPKKAAPARPVMQATPLKTGTAPAAAPAPAAKKTAVPAASAGSTKVEAAIPGKVYKIEAKAGDQVKPGDPIVILEAMKMEIPVVAPAAGTVSEICVNCGDSVESGDILARLE